MQMFFKSFLAGVMIVAASMFLSTQAAPAALLVPSPDCGGNGGGGGTGVNSGCGGGAGSLPTV